MKILAVKSGIFKDRIKVVADIDESCRSEDGTIEWFLKKGQVITLKVPKSKMFEVGEEIEFSYCFSRTKNQIPWKIIENPNIPIPKTPLFNKATVIFSLLVLVVIGIALSKAKFLRNQNVHNNTTTINANNTTSGQQPKIQFIKADQIKIENLQLTNPPCPATAVFGCNYQLEATVTNNSSSTLENIIGTVNAYDCPSNKITQDCSQVGEDSKVKLEVKNQIFGTIPPNQLRAVSGSVNLNGMPKIQGNFEWSFNQTALTLANQ